MNNMNQETNEKKVPKGTVKLSLRLLAVAGFVKPGSRIADVGTDHGYVPVYLAQTGKITSAIAMDVREGPLLRAREHIGAYEEWAGGQAGPGPCPGNHICPIEARLSDGLSQLQPGEADTVIIAGMGGGLVIRILDQGRCLWDSVKHWILSPQSDLLKVRRYLEENGFCIEEEAMVRDEGKYYQVLSVIRKTMEYRRRVWYRYGKILVERKDPILKEYLEKERIRVEGILDSFGPKASGDMTEAQKKAVESLAEELGLIKEAQDEMQ